MLTKSLYLRIAKMPSAEDMRSRAKHCPSAAGCSTAAEIGAAAVGAYNDAKKLEWDSRPECCGKKVSDFDDGYICELCGSIFD